MNTFNQPVISIVTTRFEETDAMGIIWHGNYLRYLEVGRFDWWKTFKINHLHPDYDALLMVMAEMTIEYLQPAYFDQELVVETILKKATKISISLEQKIIHKQKYVLSAVARLACCTKDSTSGKIPVEILELLKTYASE